MQIIKRSGASETFDCAKIQRAIEKAFQSVGTPYEPKQLAGLVQDVEAEVLHKWQEGAAPDVEWIQDTVEKCLMAHGCFEEAKSYILYRQQRTRQRSQRRRIAQMFAHTPQVEQVLAEIQADFGEEACPLEMLHAKFSSFCNEDMAEEEKLRLLIKAAVELTTQEAPAWEMAAGRLLCVQFHAQVQRSMQQTEVHSFYEKVQYLVSQNLYGAYLPAHYTRQEYETCEAMLEPQRDTLMPYSGLSLLTQRYVIRSGDGQPLETPQEMFLGIAMHLAMQEKTDRLVWVKKFYDMLSTLKVTMATPTLSNARKPQHQLSSCFIDMVPDSLDGIYRSLDNFAKVSKLGGGMGLYFGKVRSSGSDIRGFQGAAGGVIRWIRLVNDTAVAVDQLGMRQGAVAVYLDAWHKDLPEFLALRTNNGDDRMKAHDVFPAVCYPDLFWKTARENLEADWHLMCPHEILQVKGWALEDCFGEVWEQRYKACLADARIRKRVIPIKDLIRLILKSAVETGTPFVFNRDAVNRLNPNAHKGMIYCSNLCTEIAQNMAAIETGAQYIKEVNGEQIVVSETKPGQFVVCNLASLSLGRLPVEDEKELEDTVRTAVRAVDNVIDLNYFPLPYAKLNSAKYRPLGLGVSGYHHMLATRGIHWESDKHLAFADTLFEAINRYAIQASADLAAEKGSYAYFEGSDWHTGAYFAKRGYTSPAWQALAQKVAKNGMRNGYLLAVAPTSSTSILSGTTAGIDPVMNRFFLEEKKNGLFPRVAPQLGPQTFWYYKNAHLIDQTWSVRACGIRQRHIDQAQSMNLYITNEYTLRQVLNLYLLAYECGVKTIYYVRSKSLEVEECETCSS